MRLIKSTIAILAIVSSSVSSLAGDVGSYSYGEKFAERNCAWCHGPSLQGFATAPRLAGQKPQYTYTQLRSFIYHTRDNPLSKLYMWGAAANHLSPQTARDLALNVSTLNAKAANDGDPALAATGQRIYQEGIPVSNIPSCVACHGPAAEGFGEIPRLGVCRTTTCKEDSSSGAKDITRPQRLLCPELRANCPRTTLRPSRRTSVLSGEVQPGQR
jgi:cytochrome c553